jgi:hypothetical protein
MKKKPEPPPKTGPKPKLTDAERHKRFVDMAHEVDADESPEAFDRAFDELSIGLIVENDHDKIRERTPKTRKS